ncbi:uncharacterized protein [Dermacentor albipictus]|uniref:uncharacterized protein n=1 Tax=Dermacentor albipictus TaxID=60249 RepID=UPI0038FC8622
MLHERHTRCLKLIALVQLFFDHTIQPAFTADLKCPVLEAVLDVDWKKLEGAEWLQSLHHPNKEEVCIAMRFFPSNETMTVQTRPGPSGALSSPSLYKLRKNGDKRYIYRHDNKSYQVLDTDYASWALIHHCWEGGTGSQFIIALKEPTSEVSAITMERIQSSLAKAGQTKKLTWNRSGCMPGKRIKREAPGTLSLKSGVVPDNKAPRDKLSLVDGLAPQNKPPRDKLSLVDGLAPQNKAARDKLSLVDGLAPQNKAPRDKLSLVDGLAPQNKAARDKLSLVDGLAPQNKAPRDKLSVVDGLTPEKKKPRDKLCLVDGVVHGGKQS